MQPNPTDLPIAPTSPRVGQLILKKDQLVEVRATTGHPPAMVVRAGDVK